MKPGNPLPPLPTRFVEPVDPFERREFEVVEAAPWAFVADEFGLV